MGIISGYPVNGVYIPLSTKLEKKKITKVRKPRNNKVSYA